MNIFDNKAFLLISNLVRISCSKDSFEVMLSSIRVMLI